MSPPSFAARENRRDETSSRRTWIRFKAHCGTGDESCGAAIAGVTTAATTKAKAKSATSDAYPCPFSSGHAHSARPPRQPSPGMGSRLLLQVYSEETTTRAPADMERHDECAEGELYPARRALVTPNEKLKLAHELNPEELPLRSTKSRRSGSVSPESVPRVRPCGTYVPARAAHPRES